MSNLDISADHEPLPESRVVAFIDILGFRGVIDRIFRDKDVELFNKYRTTLTTVSNLARIVKDPPLRPPYPELLGFNKARATAFSDSIVFSDKADEHGAWRVAANVATLTGWLLRDGIACRGAIASGPTFHEGDMLFGIGFLKAYDLERSAAMYPRVIVSDDVSGLLSTSISFRIREDFDGFKFIDPFWGLRKPSAQPGTGIAQSLEPGEWDREQFEVIASYVEKAITLFSGANDPGSSGRLAKWRWLRTWLDIASKEHLSVTYAQLLRD